MISEARKVFRKGYLPGWTEETFVVYKRYPTNPPPTYVLQDLSGKEIAGRFYAEELQKIDKEIFKNQEIQLVAREPILDDTYDIKLEEGDLLKKIEFKLSESGFSNEVKFSERNGQIIVTLQFNINIDFKKNSCPRLMTALNIIDDEYVIIGEQSKMQLMQFPYTRPVESIKGESFRVIAYKTFPTTRKETKTATFLISNGMYQNAKDLFKEFKLISLRLRADSRVGLHVPQHTLVTFGEKLKDLLGFSQQTFDHESEYVLELRAGITEVYVHCDIISPLSRG
ncbi:hypothetical protein AVEN_227393-1 [Araneus ventricosus]|uniref:Uncharacterized protein n=1 Tax=Araneus ventricosus TaxID=182803 RepID=A0A4Y2GXR7_ARAVE|nr:hypothetical protein AVEN_227393-1 [Araneus ventricosus]